MSDLTPILGKKSTLSVGAGTTVINGIKHIAHSGNKVDTEDVSELNDETIDREFMGTLRDNGSISIDGNYYPSDAGQQQVAAAYGAASSVRVPFVVTYPDGSADKFVGIVTSWSTDLQNDKYIQFKAEIKISGAITSTSSASTTSTTTTTTAAA
jgi:hypothetical protein